ncbi:polyamine ABC transporter substrate-binding protein [Azospirillum halopraeferens]|uniref:polyamine ABC transporter substrate-binding protein n=1 Tax=Azospirillum halopraeferens TaxID=34010 RepID=UPI00042665F3|nr:spermidine/putrescine ABC transporter substrate-binding protein [Azospirillum halopraeferens]
MGAQDNRQPGGISRRTVLGAGGAVAGLAALGPSMPRIAGAKEPTELTMLAWYGHGEPDAVAEFERTFNVKIRPKYYVGGDQMLALMAQSPPGTYDIIHADAEYVAQLKEAGFLERLDPADYPFDDFWPELRRFDGHWFDGELYAVMTRFGFLGVSHNTDAVSEKEARSYRVLWDAGVKGRVGHLDWHLPNIACMSLYNGNTAPFDLTDAAWAETKTTLLSLKPQIRGIYDYGGLLSALKTGEVAVVPGIGDWITGVLARDGARVTTTIPEEGGLQFTESFSIGRGSRRAELAREFIRYALSPEGQVRQAMLKAYPALIPSRSGWKRLNDLHPDEAKRQRMALNGPNALDDIRRGRIHVRRLPVRQSLEDWNDLWSRYKNA